MDITIKTVPHNTQRYDTVGDWYFTSDCSHLMVIVSSMGNPLYEFLVGMHEQIEALLCLQAGIAEADVTAFDKKFEANRVEGNFDEPGDDPSAPYYSQHQIATAMEKDLAAKLGVDWEVYDAAVNAL